MKFITQLRKGGLVATLVAILVTVSVAIPIPVAASSSCSQQYLSYGADGPCVKELQQAVIGSGFSVGPHGDDGQFGPDTRQGVMDYQRAHGLSVDGIVGIQTWTHLLTGQIVPPGGGSTPPVAAPPPAPIPVAPTSVGKSMVSVESEKRHYAFDNGQLVRSMPARFGGHYWDAVKEEAGYGTTPKGLFSIGIMQADMVSNLFEAEMPHSMCFAGGALYCIHGSPMFDAYGYTHPHVEGEAGSAGCINLHTWDAEWLFDWVEPGMPLLVQTDM